jgi:hypothetical protein
MGAPHLQIVVNINENASRPLKSQQKIGKTAKITSGNKRDPRKSTAYARRATSFLKSFHAQQPPT